MMLLSLQESRGRMEGRRGGHLPLQCYESQFGMRSWWIWGLVATARGEGLCRKTRDAEACKN